MIEEVRIINRLFSITEISKILRVSRPSIYAWLDGDNPNEENALKIHELAKHAKAILDIGCPRRGFDKVMTTKDQITFNVPGCSYE